jgi:outer membrane protein assembly factor BamB
MITTNKVLAFVYVLSLSQIASGEDWLQIRGNDHRGISLKSETPTNLSKNNIAWKTPLPGRGLSSPIVIGNHVLLTASSTADQSRLHVICANKDNGKIEWERQFWATGRTICHEKTCVAAPTPVSDGKNIYALYSSNDLICLDLDGNLKWVRGLMQDYPNASNSLGLASSPIIVDETLIVQIENDSDSFVSGINLKDGSNIWKLARTKKANWTSPIRLNDKEVAVQGSEGITCVSAKSGTVQWSFNEGASTIPSSVTSADSAILYVPSNGITAIKPRKDNNTPDIVWQESQLRPGTSSPIIVGDNIYIINRAGVLNAAKKDTGERLWRLRLEGSFSGSPVSSNGHIYVASERKGVFQSIDINGKEGMLRGSIELGETILGTPAIANNSIFIRSDGHLWKISNPK